MLASFYLGWCGHNIFVFSIVGDTKKSCNYFSTYPQNVLFLICQEIIQSPPFTEASKLTSAQKLGNILQETKLATKQKL